jgi:hypothetical protein
MLSIFDEDILLCGIFVNRDHNTLNSKFPQILKIEICYRESDHLFITHLPTRVLIPLTGAIIVELG